MARDIAVIAGVGPGLGWALAKRFARAGMQVVAAARDMTKLKALVTAEPQVDVRPYGCDVAKPADVERLFEQVARELGRPNLVIFNAGAYERGGILEDRKSVV